MTILSDALFAAQFLDKGGAVFNVKHPDFGAKGDGVADDGIAWNLTRAAVPTNGGVVLVPPGDYLLTTAFTFSTQTNVLLWLFPGVVLTGSALPTPTGTNAVLDWRSGIGKFSGKVVFEAEVEIDGDLNHDGSNVGFYGTVPIAKQTGVAVTAAGIHAALVNLGLISA